MPTFEKIGNGIHARWLVDSSPVFGVIPGGVLHHVQNDTPIYLFHGCRKRLFGVDHIEHAHGRWAESTGHTIPSLLHYKLGQAGQLYAAEGDRKVQLLMRLTPHALLILQHFESRYNHAIGCEMDDHFSVTTLYTQNRAITTKYLGRYPAYRHV